MAYVVTGLCVDCKYTSCAAVCPVEAFHETPDRLYINADTCIDCDLCVPECPINAIYPEDELPECYEEWVDKNEQLYEDGEVITEKVDELEGALSLEEVQEKEQAAGLDVEEPSKAG